MVHFVGAGSGAVDLITVRGARLLTEADVIIYAGSLVNPELLDYAKADCEIHNSAKMSLEQVIDEKTFRCMVSTLHQTVTENSLGKTTFDLSGNPQYQAWVDSYCQDPVPGGESVTEFKAR